MAQDIREPKQERSIEKKNRIVQAGFELFSQAGYYNTNTAEIAKRAGVSTGIVYGYFKDKRDILLDVLEIYVNTAFAPVLNMIQNLTAPVNFDETITHVLDGAIDTHKQYANIHEALHSLSHSDEAVNNKFIELEDEITLSIAQKFADLGVKKTTSTSVYTLLWISCNLSRTNTCTITTPTSTTTLCATSSKTRWLHFLRINDDIHAKVA